MLKKHRKKNKKNKVNTNIRIKNPFVLFIIDFFGSTIGLICMLFSFYLMGRNILYMLPII